MLTFSLSTFFLEFKTPFSIAHGTRTGTDLVFLKLEYEGFQAWGEASLPPYLKENSLSVQTFVNSFLKVHNDPRIGLEEFLQQLMQFDKENYAAKACVDIALHNLFAAMEGVPVWKMLGLKNEPLPLCTFTIGMDEPKAIRNKVEGASGFQLLKIKLGGNDDKKIISAIREVTNKPLCVDVNQGWTDKEVALEMIHWLNEMNVLFVEQPLKKEDLKSQMWLHERSPLPVFADEASQVPADIEKIKDLYDGINVKLMKCGGIGEGLKMVRLARENNLKVLVGSMTESGVAISAAANLSPLADWVDLDGPLLTKNNPFDIVKYENGKVVLN